MKVKVHNDRTIHIIEILDFLLHRFTAQRRLWAFAADKMIEKLILQLSSLSDSYVPYQIGENTPFYLHHQYGPLLNICQRSFYLSKLS